MFSSKLQRCSTTRRYTSPFKKTLYVQWGPPQIGGFLEPLAIAATGLLAFFARKSKRTLWFSVGALFAILLAFPVVFFWLVAPGNAAFQSATLPSIPSDWAALRSNWETGHAIRFALQFTALASLVLSLALDSNAIFDDKKNA
jgi:Domain of unknown function (DUF1772)